MARKKRKQVGYVVWCYTNRVIAGAMAFGTCNEAKDYVEEGLRNYDFVARDVVICALVPWCCPEALVKEVQFKEVG